MLLRCEIDAGQDWIPPWVRIRTGVRTLRSTAVGFVFGRLCVRFLIARDYKYDNNTSFLSYASLEEIAGEFILCLFEAHEPN